MFPKKITLCPVNCYKTAIIIVCLNSIFELVFQYRFQAAPKTEAVYFLISGVISLVAIKDMVIKKQKNSLPLFYCFWPIIMLFIYLISACKLALLPLLVSSIIILFWGRYKRKAVKIGVSIFITAFVASIAGVIYFFPLIMLGMNKPEVLETVYSFDNKYIMVLEESDLGATGGDVDIYLGRNLDFGILGRYMPKKTKYNGHWGETPDFDFVNDQYISVNGELIEMKGAKYLSNNEPFIEARQIDQSAEGGEIVSYKNANGDILQYKITLYGETGRTVEHYYFMEDNSIYYTRLEENYRAPLSWEKEADILSKTFKKGTIIDGQFFDEDDEPGADSNIKDDEENIYQHLEDLRALFDDTYACGMLKSKA